VAHAEQRRPASVDPYFLTVAADLISESADVLSARPTAGVVLIRADVRVDVESLRAQRDLVSEMADRLGDLSDEECEQVDGLGSLLDHLLDVAEGHAR
jgi:hypothetical protein